MKQFIYDHIPELTYIIVFGGIFIYFALHFVSFYSLMWCMSSLTLLVTAAVALFERSKKE